VSGDYRSASLLAAGVVAAVALSSCTPDPVADPPPTAPSTSAPTTTTTTLADCSADPGELPERLRAGDASALSIQLSQLNYSCAHEAVVTADTAEDIRAGVTLGFGDDVPVLVEGPGVADELERLGVKSIRWVGPGPAPDFGVDSDIVGEFEVGPGHGMEADDPTSVWVVAAAPDMLALVRAAAAISGGSVLDVTGVEDLRLVDQATVDLLRARPAVPVGLDEDGEWQLATVREAAELPGGGFTFDGTRLVAFYGNPTTRFLGVLGEQDPAGSLERLAPIVEDYSTDGLRGIPGFEIIATIASAQAGADNDYSEEMDLDTLRPWIDFAAENGVYVILDLQPGRTDFLTQAKRYEEFLRMPHVGLALDPEWRLKPDQVHLRQIGTVDAEEINQVSQWLAELVREELGPQKYFIVHQFRFSMITNRETIETPPELYTVIQMDGQGPLPSKYETYRALTAGQGDVGWHWGWKNFYDEDSPMATPAQVLDVEPVVVFVSFQ
jgi:hypothetical protein